MSENTNKTTQKHGNVCKDENKSLRTSQCIIDTMSENTLKTIQRHAHLHPPKNPICINAYQVYKENTGVKLLTLTVRGDLSIHPAYDASHLCLS